VGVVGLGQCGGAMALSFALLGYDAIAFNTSETDLRGLDLPDSRKFFMSRKGSDGVGRDRELGGAIFRANSAKVLDAIQRLLGKCEHFIVCGGLAGGTGGNLGKLAGVIGEMKRPMTAIGALPRKEDGSIDKFNAVMALGEIAKAPINSLILVDNSRISRVFPGATMDAAFKGANNFIAGQLDYINRLSQDETFVPMQAFDGEDFRKVFSCQGLLTYGSTTDFSIPKGLEQTEIIHKIIVEDSLWPSGFDLARAQRAALVICAPESFFQKQSADYWKDWMEAVSGLTRGCGCYFGLFKIPEGVKPRLTVIFCGMGFPEGVRELMDEARLEAQMMRNKMEKDIAIEEMTEMEEFNFFGDIEQTDVDEVLEVESGDDSREDLDAEMEEIDLFAMGDDEGETAMVEDMVKASISEEIDDDGDAVEALKPPKRVWPYLAGGIGMIVVVAVLILIQAGYFSSQNAVYEGEKPAFEKPLEQPEMAAVIPRGCVFVNPIAELYLLVVDKSKRRLDLCTFTPDLNVLKSYQCMVGWSYGGEKGGINTPTGIYFPRIKMEGDSILPDFGSIAFRLDYPNPFDSLDVTEGDGLWLRGCAGNSPSEEDTKGSIVLDKIDMVDLAKFVELNTTPVIIYDRVNSVAPESYKALNAEINRFLTSWKNAWTGRDYLAYSSFYASDFQPQRGSRKRWLAAKKKLFPEVEYIKVEIDLLNIFQTGDGVVLLFNQDYKSNVHSDYGLKRMYLQKRMGKWMIAAEDWFQDRIRTR